MNVKTHPEMIIAHRTIQESRVLAQNRKTTIYATQQECKFIFTQDTKMTSTSTYTKQRDLDLDRSGQKEILTALRYNQV